MVESDTWDKYQTAALKYNNSRAPWKPEWCLILYKRGETRNIKVLPIAQINFKHNVFRLFTCYSCNLSTLNDSD